MSRLLSGNWPVPRSLLLIYAPMYVHVGTCVCAHTHTQMPSHIHVHPHLQSPNFTDTSPHPPIRPTYSGQSVKSHLVSTYPMPDPSGAAATSCRGPTILCLPCCAAFQKDTRASMSPLKGLFFYRWPFPSLRRLMPLGLIRKPFLPTSSLPAGCHSSLRTPLLSTSESTVLCPAASATSDSPCLCHLPRNTQTPPRPALLHGDCVYESPGSL